MDFLPHTAAHWHTIIVHLPLFTVLFSLVLLLLAAAMKDGRFQRIALAFMILAAAGTYVVQDTGHEAEDIVEQLSDVDAAMIEEHEEAAEIAVWGMYGLGAVALIVLLSTVKQKVFSGTMLTLMLICTLVVAAILVNTAKLGGQIHHPENRPAFIGPDRWGNELEYEDSEDNSSEDAKSGRMDDSVKEDKSGKGNNDGDR
jgi:glucan phosphoethanolaminetransferase (alkaline phosphatase superfamily)